MTFYKRGLRLHAFKYQFNGPQHCLRAGSVSRLMANEMRLYWPSIEIDNLPLAFIHRDTFN